LVSLGEQNCPSMVQGVPLGTLWPLLAQVHRTVAPTEMLSVFGTNTKPPHIENLAGSRWHTVESRSAILIDNTDNVSGALSRCRRSDASVARFSWRQEYHRKTSLPANKSPVLHVIFSWSYSFFCAPAFRIFFIEPHLTLCDSA